MSTKLILVLFLLSLLFKAQALTRFPAGICQLQGYFEKDPKGKAYFFTINHETNGSTTFILQNIEDEKMESYLGQYLELSIKLPKESFSSYALAEFIHFEKTLNPYSEVKEYNLPSEARSACSPLSQAATPLLEVID